MIPVLIGLGGLIIGGAVIEEMEEREQQAKPTTDKKVVSNSYVRDRMKKSGRKIKRAGDF